MQPNDRVSESGVELQRGYAWVGSSTTSNNSSRHSPVGTVFEVLGSVVTTAFD